MDHYQHSMAVKKQILDDKPLMKKIASHFMDDRKLTDVLGGGTNNIHYRAGRLTNGLWVATREQLDLPVPFGSKHSAADLVLYGARRTGNTNPAHLDIFAREAYAWTEYGPFSKQNLSVSDYVKNGGSGYVTSFCIGIKFNNRLRSSRTLYALLVEDLSAGGVFSITKSDEMDWVGQIIGTSGLIHMDLDDMPKWRKMHSLIPSYMSDQSVIDLNKYYNEKF